jgi:hypothetical protein
MSSAVEKSVSLHRRRSPTTHPTCRRFSCCHPEGDLLLSCFPPLQLEGGSRKAATALPKAGAKPKRETTDLIAFACAFIFFLQIQPKNRMSSPQPT